MKANNVLLIEADMLWVRLINKIIERDTSTRIACIQKPERHVPFDAILHGRDADIIIFDPAQISAEASAWFYKKISDELGEALVISHSELGLDRITVLANANNWT